MPKELVHNHNKNETCEPCNVAMGMYQCYWCKKWSYKENWGPGWVRCPHCRLIAPSALEEQKLKLMNQHLSTCNCYVCNPEQVPRQ